MPGVKVATEAVNGVAFCGDFIGVSTVGEIVLGVRSKIGRQTHHTFDRGAHGIITAAQGGFLACLGDDGVLFVDPKTNQTKPLKISEFPTYFYKLASINANERDETFVAAMGDHGLLSFSHGRAGFDNDGRIFHGAQIDFIDVCSIANSNHPFAFAALGSDGELILSKGINGQDTSKFDFGFPDCAAYEMRFANGVLFLLFSDRLLVMRNFVQRFLADDDMKQAQKIIEISIDASDLFVVDDSLWLLVGDGAQEFSIGKILQEDDSPTKVANGSNGRGNFIEHILKHFQLSPVVTALPGAEDVSIPAMVA